MSQRRIATYGRHGHTVRVFEETVGGSRLVRVQWRELGTGKRRTESWDYAKANVVAARAYAKGTADRLAADGAAPLPAYTLRELAEKHVAAHGDDWARATLRNFQHRWGRFEAYAGRATPARLVTETTLDEFRAELRRAGVAVNQRAETIKVVKQVFRWARRKKLLAENPIADYRVTLPKGERRAEVPEFAPEEVARLVARLAAERAHRDRRGWRLAVAVHVAATQGPRQGALLHLRWLDVNLSGRTVRHPDAPGVVIPARAVWWNPAHDKNREERVQPLTRGAVRALRIARVWARRDGYAGPYVFYRPGAGTRDHGSDGYVTARSRRRSAAKPDQPWTYQTAIGRLRALCTRAEVRWIKGRALHGFRKHAAGEAHRVTGSERAAADWIGDKSIDVVRKHYLKKRAEEQRGVAALLNAGPTAPGPAAPAAPAGTAAGSAGEPIGNENATGARRGAPEGELS